MKCLSEIPGNIVGKYWERLIFCKLKDAKIDYSYMDGDEVTPSRGTLNLARYQRNEDKRKNLQEIINDNNDSSMIVYCPNATDFDFVIFDGSGMIHAIQVTTETAVKKCPRNFLVGSKFRVPRRVSLALLNHPKEKQRALRSLFKITNAYQRLISQNFQRHI